MSNHIFEENPSAGAPQQIGGAKAKIEKQARQLLYDARYQVKKETGGKKIDPVNLQRLVSQRIDKSTSIPAVKTRAKQMMNVKEEYVQYMEDSASNLVANALYKVFVEGVRKEESIELDYLKELAENPDKKYKVSVYDPKTETRYVRYATREKITQLRSKGLKVELTEYGDPRESEAKKGSQTASALGGGTAKKDYDGDGKVESGAKEHAGAVHNAIQRKKGGVADGKDTSSVKEDFIADAARVDQNTKKITGKGVDNYSGKNPVVRVSPEDGAPDRAGRSSSRNVYAHYEVEGEVIAEKAVSKAQQRFMGMVYAAKSGAPAASPEVAKAAEGMSKGEARKFAKTKHEGLPVRKEETECDTEKKDGEEDPRSMKTKVNLVKNKLRAMGLKMSYEPEGEVLDERRREDKEAGTPRKPRDKAFELVAKSVGIARMGVEPRGKKKVPGQKPPAAGEYGSERRSPEQIVRNNRAVRKQGQENMSSRFD
jgi:hypothetical protein